MVQGQTTASIFNYYFYFNTTDISSEFPTSKSIWFPGHSHRRQKVWNDAWLLSRLYCTHRPERPYTTLFYLSYKSFAMTLDYKPTHTVRVGPVHSGIIPRSRNCIELMTDSKQLYSIKARLTFYLRWLENNEYAWGYIFRIDDNIHIQSSTT